MCGSYNITTPAEAMQRVFRFAGPLPNLPPRYNVAPTQDALCIAKVTGDTPACGFESGYNRNDINVLVLQDGGCRG